MRGDGRCLANVGVGIGGGTVRRPSTFFSFQREFNMRRLALSLVATCGLAALTACGSGGYGLNAGGNQTPTSIQFTNGSGQVDDFFVALNGSAPVLVTGTAVHGSGTLATVIPDVQFTWSATYAPKGTTYLIGSSPNGQGTCGAAASPTPINSLLQQGGSGNPSIYPGYTQLSPENTLSGSPYGTPAYGQQAAEIFVGPPLVPSGADPSADVTLVPVQPATAGGNYCLTLTATAVPSGVTGHVTVVVTP
jgi:hypothetical protein